MIFFIYIYFYDYKGGIPLPHVEQDNVKSSISAYPKSDGSESIPAWIAFDRKVKFKKLFKK